MASVSSLQFLLLQCSNIRATPSFSSSSSSCCCCCCCCSNSTLLSTSSSTSSSSLNINNRIGYSGVLLSTTATKIKRKSLQSTVMCFQKNQYQSQLMNYYCTTTTPPPSSVNIRCNNNINEDDEINSSTQQLVAGHHHIMTNKKMIRRETLFQLAFAAVAAISSPSVPLVSSSSVALAEETTDAKEDFRIYSDEKNKFNIMIPQDWQVGAGPGNGIKSLTAFYPPVASESNVSVLITGLGADFTRLESFGKVDEFAETLVSGLDRSWQRPPGVKAKLINSKASKGFYYIEYSLQNPGESCRHIFTSLGIASNTWYNKLYTVTGQFLEEDAEKYGSKIQKSVSSFKFT